VISKTVYHRPGVELLSWIRQEQSENKTGKDTRVETVGGHSEEVEFSLYDVDVRYRHAEKGESVTIREIVSGESLYGTQKTAQEFSGDATA